MLWLLLAGLLLLLLFTPMGFVRTENRATSGDEVEPNTLTVEGPAPS